jgi:hypothetical protein
LDQDEELNMNELVATTMISTCAANNSQLTNTAGGIQPPRRLADDMIA